jgi:UDP-N-acetylmuramoyl-L-alanyl-D-glutamate--2,6-diaminopimelate ligase
MMRKLKNMVWLWLAVLVNALYGFPGLKIRVVGVTGTDGKTTTSSLIYHILKTAGHKTALITTVGAYINGQVHDTGFHVTTPSSFALQKFLRQAVGTGHEFAVIETSSHGIDQNRNWGIPYEVAAVTNVTHEHLDYHRTFEAYAETKFGFLQSARTAVVNLDDETAASFVPRLGNEVITYSRNGDANYNLSSFPFTTPLFGAFNESNCLAAIAVCKRLGLTDEQVRAGLANFAPPPGRQQMAYEGKFKVMVDFAHTPNSVENILKEAKATGPSRLVHLFGAPGRRDASKRPLMGQASSKYADVIVLTADDPRDEKVSDINRMIKEGVSLKFALNDNLFEIEDRRQALEFTLNSARPGDFIVLTGKGHEPTLAMGDQEIPWNEGEIVKEILRK